MLSLACGEAQTRFGVARSAAFVHRGYSPSRTFAFSATFQPDSARDGCWGDDAPHALLRRSEIQVGPVPPIIRTQHRFVRLTICRAVCVLQSTKEEVGSRLAKRGTVPVRPTKGDRTSLVNLSTVKQHSLGANCTVCRRGKAKAEVAEIAAKRTKEESSQLARLPETKTSRTWTGCLSEIVKPLLKTPDGLLAKTWLETFCYAKIEGVVGMVKPKTKPTKTTNE